MDPDFSNTFTQPSTLDQFLTEGVIARGMCFVNQDRKKAKEAPEGPNRKWAVQMNCVFFSNDPMALSEMSKLCVSNLAADSLRADHEAATQSPAASLTDI